MADNPTNISGVQLKAEKGASILLIDDHQEVLDSLKAALENAIQGTPVDVKVWLPSEGDGDPLAKLESLVDKDTTLVATDYDLTNRVRGLFGLTIVGWCQRRFIPVGDFSRGNVAALPKEPNLFELRVPPNDVEGARFIASTCFGFHGIRTAIASNEKILSKLSLAGVLATLLSRRHLESEFALYMTRLGASNSALLDELKAIADNNQPSAADKKQLLTYVLGHVLLNAILKYPGPILSDKALCAYVATSDNEADSLYELFRSAKYDGPFSSDARYYWRGDVDNRIDELGVAVEGEEFEMFGDFNRAVVERTLGRKLQSHDCNRCGGVKGGFLCPFTQRPVCLRSDCSVAASSWIPQGAQLCRVERDFYDEWAPLLGL
jgi:hypothetical protein